MKLRPDWCPHNQKAREIRTLLLRLNDEELGDLCELTKMLRECSIESDKCEIVDTICELLIPELLKGGGDV